MSKLGICVMKNWWGGGRDFIGDLTPRQVRVLAGTRNRRDDDFPSVSMHFSKNEQR
jgi:hypothetical protein